MRRLWVLFLDLVFLVILIGALVAFWGFRSTNSEEDAPATVRVSKGQASTVDLDRDIERRGGGLLSLPVGQAVRVDSGSDAFLFYADGSISRLTGPAEVRLTESKRTIRKPPILSSLKTNLFHQPPPPPAEARIDVQARVVKGDITTKAAAHASGSFEMRGPGVIIRSAGSSFALNVPEQGDISVEVGQGQLAVGMVSFQGDQAVPVVVPALGAKQGINVPRLPPDKTDAKDVISLEEKVSRAAPAVKPGSGKASAEGIDFQEMTGASIPYFAGVRLDGHPLAQAPAVSSRTVASTTTITDKLVVPGLAQTTITDKTIADKIPQNYPGSPKIHILSGNMIQVEYQGLTFVASVDVVDGRAQLNGLPFGVDPPQIEKAIKDALGTNQLPALLSVSSANGQATIAYSKDAVTTSTTNAGNAVEVPESLPHVSPYFSTIPTPREISTDWKVAGSNALIALLVTFLASNLAGPVNKLVSENEGKIVRAYKPFSRIGKGLSEVGRALRWVSPGPLTRGLWLMFIFGAVYSFLAVGKGLMGPSGLTILLTLTFTSGFMAIYGPWVRAFVARRMKLAAKVGLYPGQLGVAVIWVAVSRVFAFKPGLILGSPGGLKLDGQGPSERQKFWMEVFGVLSLVILGAFAWVLVFFLPEIGAQSWAAGFFKTAKGFVSGLQDWSLAIFAVAVQGIFFALLPRPKSFGLELLKKQRFAWGAAFAISSFVFIYTLLNKQKSIMDLTTNMIITVVLIGVLALLAFGYRLRTRKPKEHAPESVVSGSQQA